MESVPPLFGWCYLLKMASADEWATPPWRDQADRRWSCASSAAQRRAQSQAQLRPRGRWRDEQGREGGYNAHLRVNQHGVERDISRRLAEEAAPVTTDVRTDGDVIDLAMAFAATDADGRQMLTDTKAFSQLRKECKGKGRSKGQQVLSRADQLVEESRRSRVSALEATRMRVQVQLFRRSEAAYSIMLLVTRHNTWTVHPFIYKMTDGFIPFRFLLTLTASRAISPPLEAVDFWNAMEIDYHYPHPRLELRRGGVDDEALVRSTRGQTFKFPASAGEMVAGVSLNPAASVWDNCGPDSSILSSQLAAVDGSVRAVPDGDARDGNRKQLERMEVLTIRPGMFGYHGTFEPNVKGIAQSGIRRMGRVAIHLFQTWQACHSYTRCFDAIARVDLAHCHELGIKFVVDRQTQIVLTEGLLGIIPIQCVDSICRASCRTEFLLHSDHRVTNAVLYSQKLEALLDVRDLVAADPSAYPDFASSSNAAVTRPVEVSVASQVVGDDGMVGVTGDAPAESVADTSGNVQPYDDADWSDDSNVPDVQFESEASCLRVLASFDAEEPLKPPPIPEDAPVIPVEERAEELIAVLEWATGITTDVAGSDEEQEPENKVAEVTLEGCGRAQPTAPSGSLSVPPPPTTPPPTGLLRARSLTLNMCGRRGAGEFSAYTCTKERGHGRLESDRMCCNHIGQTYWGSPDDSESAAGVLRAIEAVKAIHPVQQKIYDIAERHQQGRPEADDDAERRP